jgi:hypothetical protein
MEIMRYFFQLLTIIGFPIYVLAQQDTPSLTRHLKNGNSIKIPFTIFSLVDHAGLSKDYDGAWMINEDFVINRASSILVLEMNCTDLEDWVGDEDVSGSMQLIIFLPAFKDTVSFSFNKSNSKAFHLVNNYGGPSSINNLASGTLKLIKKDSGCFLTASLLLTTQKPFTKQEIKLKDIPIKVHSLLSFNQLMDAMNRKREKEQQDFTQALSEMIIARDSVWEEEERKNPKVKEKFKGPFRFWMSQVNKAAYSRTTYYITEDSITIKKGPYDFLYYARNYPADKIASSHSLSQDQRGNFLKLSRQLKGDSLESTYTNFCIIDGLILHFDFEWEDKEINTTISNYYLPEIANVLNFVNTIVPRNFQIGYSKEFLLKSQKNCDLFK